MNQLRRILYVAPLGRGTTSLQRMEALQDLGHELRGLNTDPPEAQRRQATFLYRVRRKLLGPSDLAGINGQILTQLRQGEWDILWLDKGLTVERRTLEEAKRLRPHCVIVGYSPDDMAARHNQSRQFLDHLPLYDVFFTTKTYGVAELQALGCRRVHFVANAFDPRVHRPWEVSDEDRTRLGGPVGFIGDYEWQRAEAMAFLARNGIPVRIWGPNWHKCRLRHSNLRIEGRCLWAADYGKAICAFDINLGFLRKINRDRQTQRSIEIPACSAFMLAERTDEHLQLFEEGQEAEFFASEQELLEKTRYYLEHPDKRRRIALGGRQRCLNGYSNADRLRGAMECIGDLLAAPSVTAR